MEDITLRALRTLKEVDFILCEDTRVTRKLLAHYDIHTPCIAYHQHSDERKVAEIKALLEQGKNLALVTDAGTPGISDPGGKLVEALVINPPASPFAKGGTQGGFSHAIVPIPGPSALTAALSISGFPTDHFVFMGFPPHKKHRKQYFEKVAACPDTVAFYESTHRIIKTLEELKGAIEQNHPSPDAPTSPTGLNPLPQGERANMHPRLSLEGRGPAVGGGEGETRQLVVCRELTKMFETVYRGTAEEVLDQIKKNPIKGEFVVVVGPKK